MKTIPANARGRTVIGRLGENEHRRIFFRETAELIVMYPEAVVTVLHQRPGDPDAYPVAPEYVRIEDGMVYWTVQSGDLARTGDGLCEVAFVQDSVVAKTLIYMTEILDALDGAGTPPEPWEGWQEGVTEAADLARGYADGKHLDGSDNTSLSENNAKFFMELCLVATGHYPKVENGYWYVWDVQNEQWSSTGVKATGADGEDGVSPTITVTDITGGHRVTITDATGDHSFDVMDGEDGYSPSASVSKSGQTTTITITDKNGTTTAQVVDGTVNVETVSGSTPSITGVANTRYMCGEVASISITPPQSGDIEVMFDSGTTATVLTVPSGIKWPSWFDPTDLETSVTYDIIITDGEYGVVGLWA